jgi:hypothetical protein
MDDGTERIGEVENARIKYAETPEPVKKMIRLREAYPFLQSPDCPDVLKILVADMITAYNNYKAAYARLQTLGDEDSAQAAADCETVVTEYLKNKEIWEELEYYKTNGAILGKAEKFKELQAAESLSKLSEMELMKQLQSAASNESKHKKTVNEARAAGETNEKAEAAYARWSARKATLQAEVARRKKK